MDPSILATRQARAQARIARAVDVLASDRSDLDAERAAIGVAPARNPKIAALDQAEAIATLLEKVVGIEPDSAPYVITEQITPAPDSEPAGEPESDEITYDEFRTKRGTFAAADEQDADGKAEKVTHARSTHTPRPETKKVRR